MALSIRHKLSRDFDAKQSKTRSLSGTWYYAGKLMHFYYGADRIPGKRAGSASLSLTQTLPFAIFRTVAEVIWGMSI